MESFHRLRFLKYRQVLTDFLIYLHISGKYLIPPVLALALPTFQVWLDFLKVSQHQFQIRHYLNGTLAKAFLLDGFR